MNFKDFYMSERLMDRGVAKSIWGDKLYNEIHKNPDKSDMLDIKIKNAKNANGIPSIRFGINKAEDVIVWSSPDILHEQIEKKYKLKFKWKYEYYSNKIWSGHNNPKLTDGLIIRLANIFGVNKLTLKRL